MWSHCPSPNQWRTLTSVLLCHQAWRGSLLCWKNCALKYRNRSSFHGGFQGQMLTSTECWVLTVVSDLSRSWSSWKQPYWTTSLTGIHSKPTTFHPYRCPNPPRTSLGDTHTQTPLARSCSVSPWFEHITRVSVCHCVTVFTTLP